MINAGALDTDKLFVKTKQLITSVLPCTKESNLLGSLKSKTSGEEAEKYWRLVEQKEQVEKTAENNKSMLEHTNLFQVRVLYYFPIFFCDVYAFLGRRMCSSFGRMQKTNSQKSPNFGATWSSYKERWISGNHYGFGKGYCQSKAISNHSKKGNFQAEKCIEIYG